MAASQRLPTAWRYRHFHVNRSSNDGRWVRARCGREKGMRR